MTKLEGWTWTVLVLLLMLAIPPKAYRMLLFALVFPLLCLLALAACDQKRTSEAPPTPQLSPRDLFEVQTECADMVKKDFGKSDGHEIVTAHYNAVRNRCYGERRVLDIQGVVVPDFMWLEDEQTMEEFGCKVVNDCFIGTRTGLSQAEVEAYIKARIDRE
jgi:hypothetical protein